MSSMLLMLHKIAVSLFLLSYIIRLIGLVGNIAAIQNLYAKKIMRILVDMIISTIFLITGVWMITLIPGSLIGTMVIVKIVLVFISIPLAVVGFKKNKKPFAIIATLLILGAYGLGEMNKKNPVINEVMLKSSVGASEVYVGSNCNVCHGPLGDMPVASIGAKNLAASKLSDDEIISVISNGKGFMPGYKNKLSGEQIKELVDYVKSFRK